MDPTIIVAIIGVTGSITVAVLNHLLSGKVKEQESKITKLYALSMSDNAFGQLKKLSSGNYGAFYLDPNLSVGLAA